ALSVCCALSLHDALPIFYGKQVAHHGGHFAEPFVYLVLQVVDDDQLSGDGELPPLDERELVVGGIELSVDDGGMCARGSCHGRVDRKSTRLNSSHVKISY